MKLHEWTTVAAATGQLSLGVLTALRGGRSPLAPPLALLCFCIFGWNSADLAYTMYEEMSWKLVDHALSPFTAPLVLHFVLVFTGFRRKLRVALTAAYLPLALLSLSAIAGFIWPAAMTFQDSDTWSLLHLGLAVPILALCVGCLLAYRREADPEGWRRARLILVALSLGAPLAVTDLLEGIVSIPMPPLANMATLLAAALLAVVALRLRLFGTDLSTSAATFAAGLAILVVLTYALLLQVLARSTAELVLATATTALVLVFLLRMVAAAGAARRARETQLITLGRFAAQLAHDLKNPLAAMKGGVQFLAEERRRGASLDASAGYLELLLAQVERMERSLDAYERLGRVEPALAVLDVNDLVRDVLALQSAAGVNVQLALATDLPAVAADRDLLGRAVENLVRNAVEAMPDGGTLTVSTARAGEGVAVAVRDTGEGMDASTRERALDEFFTTKASGSGLGLPFVRRVALAHGGEVVLSSRRGRGTLVEIRLPAAR